MMEGEVVMVSNNNYRKRHHLVKITRHWKAVIKLSISNETLRNAFGSSEELNKLLNYIINDMNSQLKLYKWCNIEEVYHG